MDDAQITMSFESIKDLFVSIATMLEYEAYNETQDSVRLTLNTVAHDIEHRIDWDFIERELKGEHNDD